MPDIPRKLYLAGPMSGYPEHNFPLFHQAARLLRAAGHEVFNPAENNDDGVVQSRAYYMRLDIPALLASEAVVLLPDWQQSRGANLEVWIALDLDLPVYRGEIRGGRITLHLMENLELPCLPFCAEKPCPR